MHYTHALPPKQPARQAPVDAAHADRHHRPPANPSGLAGSNCGERDVPATAEGDAADQASRGFEGWPRTGSNTCMHFTCILHASNDANLLRQWQADAAVAGSSGSFNALGEVHQFRFCPQAAQLPQTLQQQGGRFSRSDHRNDPAHEIGSGLTGREGVGAGNLIKDTKAPNRSGREQAQPPQLC